MDKYKIVEEFVSKCDEAFSESLCAVADKISLNEDLKIVSLAGPTCSGKTTAANMLLNRFAQNGLKGHIISIDDFFYDRDYLVKISLAKGLNKPDYESIDTIDFEALKLFIDEIFESNEVHCPQFDFQKGIRSDYRTIKIDKNDIFIFEGIQSIYPDISRILQKHGAASIYIAPLSALEESGRIFYPNEIRLMRRLVRDYNFRGTAPDTTFDMWEGVRSNEEKNIFPYIEGCVYHIDSTLRYELGVLAPYLRKILPLVPCESTHYKASCEMLDRIKNVKDISADILSEGSLYQEFV